MRLRQRLSCRSPGTLIVASGRPLYGHEVGAPPPCFIVPVVDVPKRQHLKTRIGCSAPIAENPSALQKERNDMTTVKRQHKTPCRKCPFRRNALMPGFLGGEATPEEFRWMAASDTYMPCHQVAEG